MTTATGLNTAYFSPSALRRARIDRGMSAEVLAAATSQSEGDLERLETGAILPALPTVAWLAEVLGVAMLDLMTAEPESPQVEKLSALRQARAEAARPLSQVQRDRLAVLAGAGR